MMGWGCRNSDWVSVHSGEWWRSSEWNMPHFDIHLCAYNAELRLVNDFMMSWLYTDEHHPTGLNRVGIFPLRAA